MYYLTNYLIYIAVLVRAAGWIQDSAPIPLPAWILFSIFGILLISERAVTRFIPWYPRVYILAQSCMVIAMLYSAPQADIFAMLFFPLSFQAVQYYSASIGFCFIAAYSAAMAGSLLFGMKFQPWIAMFLFSTGIDVMMGSFAILIERTDRSLRENQRLYGELQEVYRGLKSYSEQAEAMAEVQERQRMVRELHDSLTQTLFSMNLAVQAAQLSARQDSKQVIGHLQRLQTLSRSATFELHALSGQVPLPVFLERNLSIALKKLVNERQALGDLMITLDVTGEKELSESVKSNLYHIAQEALNNAAKHAGACQVFIRLDLTGHPASMEIADTGCGFDLESMGCHNGIGVKSMAERALEIGWDFTITSAPGNGTQIRILEKQA